MSDLSTTAQAQLATIGRAFAGIAEFSADKMLEHYTDDLVLEMPYAVPPVTLNGKPTILKYLRGAFKIFQFAIEITDVYEIVDPTMLILEYTRTVVTAASADQGSRDCAVSAGLKYSRTRQILSSRNQ